MHAELQMQMQQLSCHLVPGLPHFPGGEWRIEKGAGRPAGAECSISICWISRACLWHLRSLPVGRAGARRSPESAAQH